MPAMTLKEFAQHVSRAAARAPGAETMALRSSGFRLVREAQSYIGQYQPTRGPFPAWKRLAYGTLHGGTSPAGYRYMGKIELGFAPPDRPLLRTGQMRGSIEFTVGGRGVTIGSPDPVARWQEFGLPASAEHAGIPPRPFIGPALYTRGKLEANYVARVVFRPLLRGR